jgi:flagellar biosynthesis/type III secretory pathway protein FliH
MTPASPCLEKPNQDQSNVDQIWKHRQDGKEDGKENGKEDGKEDGKENGKEDANLDPTLMFFPWIRR